MTINEQNYTVSPRNKKRELEQVQAKFRKKNKENFAKPVSSLFFCNNCCFTSFFTHTSYAVSYVILKYIETVL